MSEIVYGPPRVIITSIYDFSPEALEQLAQQLETRGIRQPVANLIGASPALTHITQGTGSPETVVTGSVGALYLRLDGGAGTTLYVKESGVNTKTGWVGK